MWLPGYVHRFSGFEYLFNFNDEMLLSRCQTFNSWKRCLVSLTALSQISTSVVEVWQPEEADPFVPLQVFVGLSFFVGCVCVWEGTESVCVKGHLLAGEWMAEWCRNHAFVELNTCKHVCCRICAEVVITVMFPHLHAEFQNKARFWLTPVN